MSGTPIRVLSDEDACALLAARAELVRVRNLHPGSFASAHEGYAVILEELDELWEHVRCKREQRALSAMRTEAIQIAASALRFAADITPTGENEQ